MSCDQCQLLRINGIVCHETGCPEAWKYETIPCFECGFDFTRDSRWQTVCSDCLADRESEAVAMSFESWEDD